jgi:hypothetical protein
MQKLNLQDFFRSQNSSSGELVNGLDFGKPVTKESCPVFATGYSEDDHMTRIYFCRPLSEQTNFNEEASNVFGTGS